MKIGKEKEVEIKIHKKQDGKIHKKKDVKKDNKTMSTRTKNNARAMRKVAESKILYNIEGCENIEETFETTGMAIKPIKSIVSEGNRIRKKAKVSKHQKEVVGSRLRKRAVNKGRELAKKSGRKVVKKTSKKMAKDTGKKVAKESAKIATKAGTAVAGSVAGPEGALIGAAAGEATGMKIDNTFYKAEQRSRMMKFFMDKLKPNEEQNDNLFKLVGSMVRTKMTFMIKRAVSLLALFLPPLESGDTIQSVTTQYVSEFNQEIQTLIDEHKDADKGRKVYVDYEGMDSEPSNYYDIMSVYMVKYGYENTATKMNETNKQNLKAVFDDMCKYTTENVTEKKGKKKTKYLEVRITLKTYTEMAIEYQFDEDRTAILNQLMSAYITNNPSGGSQISGLQGSLTPQEISNITDKISNPTQKAVASFVLSKVGYPYSQPLRNSGKAFDCSSLAYYAWKSAGVDISFGGGTTAAAEAEGLKDKTVKEENLQPGDLIFYSYTTNGRYKNISHVGIYVGNGKMVEAVDEAHGVCLGNYHNGGLVMICRPGK